MTDPQWIRSSKLGNPEILRDTLDIMRMVRDYLQIMDPIAQGLATVAELECRIIEIFQAISAPRALGLLAAELLMEFIKPYLSDGAYFIQHSNLRELMERVGVGPAIEGMEQYVERVDQERGADLDGELSSFIQFGPAVDEDGSAFQSYRQMPQIIQGQLDLRRRSVVKSALDAFQDVELNSFDDWLYPILAAFHDPGDPLRPVVFEQDKIGALMFAVQGSDPKTVIEAFSKLEALFSGPWQAATDFSDLTEDWEENLGWDTIQQWEMSESLQWNGIQTALRPHLLLKYSTSPDFLRLSTADLLPFFGDLLLDMSNLLEFAGFPFPENFSLVTMAEKLARKIRTWLELLDRAIEILSAIAGILDLADVWRLVVPPESGGVDNLIQRIQDAPRDDMVRLTWGTLIKSVDAKGDPVLTTYTYGRIQALPDDTSGVPEYTGQQVGDWLPSADLSELSDAFDLASRPGFTYSEPKVYRAGELMRQSWADKLRTAFPSISYETPGDLLIYGVGIFMVEGAISRLFASIFGIDDDDTNEWLLDGPPAGVDASAFTDLSLIAPSFVAEGTINLQGTFGDSGIDRGGDVAVPNETLPPFGQNTPGDANAVVATARPPERALGRSDRHGATRSFDYDSRAILGVPDARIRNTFLRGRSMPELGQATLPLGDEGTGWMASEGLLSPGALHSIPPHGVFPTSVASSPTAMLEVETWALGTPAPMGALPDAGVELPDVTINPGGTSIVSITLQLQLDTFFPSGTADAQWVLDLGLTFEDGVVRYCRCYVEGYLGSTIYVYPALPCSPLLASNIPVTAVFYVADEPSLWMDPALPAPEDPAASEDAPAVTFDAVASWRKTGAYPHRDYTTELGVTLQAVAGAHTVDVDSDGWGNFGGVTLSVASDGLSMDVGLGQHDGEVHDLTNFEAWPGGDAQAVGTLDVGENLTLKPAEIVGDWRALAAVETVTTVWAHHVPDGELYTRPWGPLPINDLWRALTVSAPRMVRIGLGIVGVGALVYVQPSLWSYLLVLHEGSWLRVETSDLDGGLPGDGDDSGLAPRPSWVVALDAPTVLAYAGDALVLVAEIGADTGAGVEGSWGRVRPHALWSPFVRRFISDFEAWVVNDTLLLGSGPWGRAGLGIEYGSAFGGADPSQTGSVWSQTIPLTGKRSLRPRDTLRAGAIALDLVTGRESWFWAQGRYMILGGRSHRVMLTAHEVGLTVDLDAFDAETDAWVEQLTLELPHLGTETRIAFVAQVLPSLGRLDLMVSTYAGGTVGYTGGVWEYTGGIWSALGTATVSDLTDVRALEGLSEAGGTWQIGQPSWRGSVLDTDVRLPWRADDGLMAGCPPCGLIDLAFRSLTVDAPDAMLDLYR